MKKAILILGMHRTGSSSLSAVINFLGAYLGEDLLGPNEFNKKGHFENLNILNLNNSILINELDNSWHNTDKMEVDNKEEFVPKIKEVIKTTFGDKEIISIKDPRLCLLFPVYKKALEELGYEIYILKTNRDKNEILKSLIKRSPDFTKEKASLIIDKHLNPIKDISGLVINFNDLLNNTDKVITALKKHVPFLNYNTKNIKSIKSFLDKSLKNE